MAKSLISTVCPYCAVGCGLYLCVEKGRATGIDYMLDHPANEGALCAKGNALLEIVEHEERLRCPMKREGEEWRRISWEEALNLVAQGLLGTKKKYGPEALAFLSSAKCTNEENYLMQKLARLMGSPHVDNSARLCHAPTVVALNQALGAAAMTNPGSDLENSRCIFIIGSNLAETHPVLSRWIHRARDKGATVIVADPRRTPTSWMADIFLQIRPGTDVALTNGMARLIIDEGLHNHQFIDERTRGFSELVSGLKGYSLERVSDITGVPPQDIARAARAYARSPASAILYSMGITQHTTGTDNVFSLANLALLCGHIGGQGKGILPLRGQNNVQGACDMGALPEFYPGYRPAHDPQTRQFFSRAWVCGSLPGRGMTVTEMMEAALHGDIRAMYIMGKDPVNSYSHSERTVEALQTLDFLVVQDIFMTATARLADLILPAATWTEKEGSITSTERRVQWTEQALPLTDESRPDLWILVQVAKKLGLDFDYKDASEVLEEISRMVPSYGGISKERLGRGGIIWPCPTKTHPGTPILHETSFRTSDGRAVFHPVEYVPPAEVPGKGYPFTLTTGRLAVHHNAGSMTRRSPTLMGRDPDLYVEINPLDAEELGIKDGDLAEVSTIRGSTTTKARVTERVRKGLVFMPFHFPGTNELTSTASDRWAKIPEFKVAACNISRRS